MKEKDIDNFIGKQVQLFTGDEMIAGLLSKITNYRIENKGSIKPIKNGYFLQTNKFGWSLRAKDIKQLKEV